MAIIDKNQQNWLLVDTDQDQFIGLTLPLYLDNGDIASTKTTIEAVKQNLFNLCSTEAGERIMQPNLGVRLKRFLFEPGNTANIIGEIQQVIKESINYWLPFLLIKKINVVMSEDEGGNSKNTMEITINFALQQNPNMMESVQIQL